LIRLVIFDVDGVLTDGSIFLRDDGHEYKVFNAQDGHGIKMLQESGVAVAIITGGKSPVVKLRMEQLGIKYVYVGCHDKLPPYLDLKAGLGLTNSQIAYVGDDVIDLPVMQVAGLAIAVPNANHLVKKHAHWQTQHSGGQGAVREICEFIMDAQGTLEGQLAQYLN